MDRGGAGRNMTTAIAFDTVSKRFRLQRNRPRTLQEKFVSLFQRNSTPASETFWALKDVSFTVEKGQTVGLIGPNGSGKSTALKLMARILEPTSGEITVNGRVSALLELGAGFHPDLTGRENVYLNGSLLGLRREEVRRHFDEIVAFSELEDFIDMPVKHYSSGMYVRLGFAVAVHLQPEILLIDEVLAVGDAAFQTKCMDRIAKLRREGVTIVFVSHDLGSVQSLCEHAIWFDHGVAAEHGHPTDVVMAYLNRVAEEEEAASGRKPHEDHNKHRWGTGKVRVTDVTLCDDKGQPRSVFYTGDEMNILLHYTTHERIEAPVFGLAIHHQNGTHICGPNTKFSELNIPFVEGTGQILYRIPTLMLLKGTYELSVAVTNQTDSEMFDYHDRMYPFRVYPGQHKERYGLVSLNGEWHIEYAAQLSLVPIEPRATVK